MARWDLRRGRYTVDGAVGGVIDTIINYISDLISYSSYLGFAKDKIIDVKVLVQY